MIRTIAVSRLGPATARAVTHGREALSVEGGIQDPAREADHTHAVQHLTAGVAVVAEAVVMILHHVHAHDRGLGLVLPRLGNLRASAPTHHLFPAPAPALVRHLVVATAALHTRYPAHHLQNQNLRAAVALQRLRLALRLRVVGNTQHPLRDRRHRHQDADATQAAHPLGAGVRRLVHRRRKARGKQEMIVRVRHRDAGGILVARRHGGGETRSRSLSEKL